MLCLQVTLGYHASFIYFTLLISIARMRKYIISPPILLMPCTSPSPDNLGFRTVSWEMETLNPWGWGGPRAHCPTSWVRALILRLLQERRALALLSPPPAAAFKRRKQLWVHSWRVWSCEWEVVVFPAHLQDWALQGAPMPLCLTMPDGNGVTQAKLGGTWGAEAPPGLGGGRRISGVIIFVDADIHPMSFLPGVISHHWCPSGREASMKPLDGQVGTTREVLVSPNTRISLWDMVFYSQNTQRSCGGTLMQSPGHMEQILTWISAYSLKMTRASAYAWA